MHRARLPQVLVCAVFVIYLWFASGIVHDEEDDENERRAGLNQSLSAEESPADLTVEVPPTRPMLPASARATAYARRWN